MKTRIAALGVLLALTLTGCASAPENAPSVAERTSAAETPVAESPAKAEQTDAESAYLKFLADHPRQGTVIPDATDEQRLAAGYQVCTLLAEGKEAQDITVIEGEQRNPDSGTYIDSYDMVSAAATSGLCD